ncbi:hypothetical protein BDC45DRAFT_573424 [Circinella umbellata]|nr:hypothetical protein BDC45DRAFT_573424 [Circinella umbellata]
MALARKAKDANVQLQFYEQINIITSFESIKEPLLSELQHQQPDLTFEARDLSILIGHLQQFQQDFLGINNIRPNNAPLRIPAKLFKVEPNQPLTIDSPVYHILRATYTYRIAHDWRKFDFGPSKKSKNVDLIRSIRDELFQINLINLPIIGLDNSVPNSARKTITNLAKKIHLQVVDDIEGATHILHGPLHEYDAVEEEWFRTLEKRENNVLVHWWYFPDSYDSWLPQTDQFADPEEAPVHEGSWHISTRWLQDSVKYNELMNEEDYEEVDDEEEHEEGVGEEEEEEEKGEEAGEVVQKEQDEEELPDAPPTDPMQNESVSESQSESAISSTSTPLKSEPIKQKTRTPSLPSSTQTQTQTSTATTRKVSTSNASSSNAQQQQQQERQQTSQTEPVQVVVAPPVPVLNPESQPEVRIRDIEKERPQLGSRQRKNEFEPYINADITNISQFIEDFIDHPVSDQPTFMQLDSVESNNNNSNNSDIDTPMEEVVNNNEKNNKDVGDEKKIDEDHDKEESGDDDDEENEEDEDEEEEEEDDESKYLNLSKVTPYDGNSLPCPDWFNMSSISDVEKVALPEFFKDQEKQASEYKKYRNFMIETYRRNPSYYLTFSACKRALKIDMLVIIRIHTFLEHAGLINYLVDPRRRLFDPYIDSEPDAQVHNRGTQRDFTVNDLDIQLLRDLVYKDIPSKPEQSQWDVQIYDDLNADGRTVFTCSNCHEDCSEVRYQSLKYKKLQLCVSCFLEGKFTAASCKGEFLRVDRNDREVLEEDWSKEEILRLLEAVDQFDEDWLAISEHVGTRTKEQCITQFLQLPIHENFLTAKLSDKELEELPFGDQANPVMTLIAFLSGHINPGIGSFAAKSALKELMKEPNSTKNSISENTVADNAATSDNDDSMDEMDVDDRGDADVFDTQQDAFSRETMKKATIAALKSAVEHAKKLASYEHEEIQHWTRLVVKTLVDKLQIKVQQYDEQEIFLDNELKELDKQGTALLTSLEALSKQYPLNASSSSSNSTGANANANNITTTTTATTPSITPTNSTTPASVATPTLTPAQTSSPNALTTEQQ